MSDPAPAADQPDVESVVHQYPLSTQATPGYLRNLNVDYEGIEALFTESSSAPPTVGSKKRASSFAHLSPPSRKRARDGAGSAAEQPLLAGQPQTPVSAPTLVSAPASQGQHPLVQSLEGVYPAPEEICASPPAAQEPLSVAPTQSQAHVSPAETATLTPVEMSDDDNNSPHFLLSPSMSPVDRTAVAAPMAANFSLGVFADVPEIVNSFSALPAQVQRYAIYNLLRRCDRGTLSAMSSLITSALRCDFITLLPPEISQTILAYLDYRSLCQAVQVSKSWQSVIQSADHLWKALLETDGLVSDDQLENHLCDLSCACYSSDSTSHDLTCDRAFPYKSLYRRHHELVHRWMDPATKPKHICFPAHGREVVTCLQFDDERIITGSEDHTINIYATATGQLQTTLRGHDGGVWALQYVDHRTLVSGSTDRTVRVWDIEQGRCTHIFDGHTSTVRCLDIIKPAPVTDRLTGHTRIVPEHPLIVTGSRDTTLRVWRLPRPADPDYLPERPRRDRRNDRNRGDEDEEANADGDAAPPETSSPDPDPVRPTNQFFERVLEGHTNSVRAISGYGDTVVSGSYDTTVRVWNVTTGQCKFELTGHNQRVYSAVLDTKRNRCISGSMDWFVKVWCLDTGSLLYTLEGHTSLVGLLDLNRSTLVSAAADSTLRVWNPENGAFLHKLQGHTGAITCFQHDEHKVVSGSETTLKLWNIRTGKFVRDLLSGLASIWQVRFDHRRCVAAVKRDDDTFIEVFDFEKTTHRSIRCPADLAEAMVDGHIEL